MAWSASEKKEETKKDGGKVEELHPSGKNASKGKGKSGKDRDLAGGMEMLDIEFLLGVIEDTDGADKNDVQMRKFSFNEVLRRKQQEEIDSDALTVYSLDSDSLYGKDIQCAAMKELTKRTSNK